MNLIYTTEFDNNNQDINIHITNSQFRIIPAHISKKLANFSHNIY